MKLIIDIPDKDYEKLKDGHIPFSILDVMQNGIPIAANATNGNSVIKMFCKGIVRVSPRKNVSVEFNKNWWNAPYQKGSTNG